MNICIFGASSGEIYVREVFLLGSKIAERGHGLIFGGGAGGLMGAAVRGVQEKNGYSLGIAPHFFDKPGILHGSCSEFIFTDTMRQRKQIMEERSDAFIAVPGGIGTFEEFFEILTLRQLNRHHKPIAVFNINGYYDPLTAMIDHAFEQGFMRSGSKDLYEVFTKTCDLLDYIEKEAKK